MQFDLWQPYLISAAIGLLIGIEREKSQPHDKSMGVRTFSLLALLGALAGGLDSLWMQLLIAAFSFALIGISYFNTTRAKSPADAGLTTEFAGAIVFCLGFVSHSHPLLTSVLGPVVAVVLFSKRSLHRFTHRIKVSEMQAALLLLLIGVVVVNLLVDRVVDPWGVFNPRKFGLLVLTLAALEFISYILTKVFGEKSSSLVLGFLGGFVSSTAMLISAARRAAKTPKVWRQQAISVIAAKLAALAEVLFIVALISQPLLFRLAMPVACSLSVGLIALLLLTRKFEDRPSGMELRSPLDWRGVFRLSLMLAAILAVVALVQHFLGESGTSAISFIGGLFELHGVSLANSTMVAREQLPMNAGYLNIMIAITASLLAKIAMSWAAARNLFSRTITIIFLLMSGALWLGAFFAKF